MTAILGTEKGGKKSTERMERGAIRIRMWTEKEEGEDDSDRKR